jgi:hypothetical protein
MLSKISIKEIRQEMVLQIFVCNRFGLCETILISIVYSCTAAFCGIFRSRNLKTDPISMFLALALKKRKQTKFFKVNVYSDILFKKKIW